MFIFLVDNGDVREDVIHQTHVYHVSDTIQPSHRSFLDLDENVLKGLKGELTYIFNKQDDTLRTQNISIS